jgi:hypothetical protein
MFSDRFRVARVVTASALVALFTAPSAVMAGTAADHIVSPAELQKAAVGASEQRTQNIEALRAMFGTAQARQALENAHLNPAPRVDAALLDHAFAFAPAVAFSYGKDLHSGNNAFYISLLP